MPEQVEEINLFDICTFLDVDEGIRPLDIRGRLAKKLELDESDNQLFRQVNNLLDELKQKGLVVIKEPISFGRGTTKLYAGGDYDVYRFTSEGKKFWGQERHKGGYLF